MPQGNGRIGDARVLQGMPDVQERNATRALRHLNAMNVT